MPRLRVALLTDTYFPNANGVAVSVSLLQRELNALGHDAWVVAPRARRLPRTDHLIRVPSAALPATAGQRLALTPLSLIPRDFSVVHTHTPFSLGIYGLRLSHARNIPHISTYHTNFEEYTHYIPGLHRADRRMDVVPRVMRAFYRRADHLIAPSFQTRDLMRGYGIRQPISVIPTGIDARTLLDAPLADHLWPTGSRRLLTVGRLAREKHIPILIDALVRLRETEPAHLVILGSGPEEQTLRRYVTSRGMATHVTFQSAVSHALVGGYYRAAEVFVFASPSETQGLVVQEAQLLGLPVVAVGEGGVADLVRDGVTGYLVDHDDAIQIAAHTQELLRNGPLRLEMGLAAQAAFADATAATMARQIELIYLNAIDERPARPTRIERLSSLPLQASMVYRG